MAFSPKGKWNKGPKKSNFKEELLAIDRVTRVTALKRNCLHQAVTLVTLSNR